MTKLEIMKENLMELYFELDALEYKAKVMCEYSLEAGINRPAFKRVLDEYEIELEILNEAIDKLEIRIRMAA